MQISRSEYEKISSVLCKVTTVAKETLNQFKSELKDLKSGLETEKVGVHEACKKLGDDFEKSINKIVTEQGNSERETIQRLTVDHELEISDFRKISQGKNEEIKSLKDQNAVLLAQIESMKEENRRLMGTLSGENEVKTKMIDSLNNTIEEIRQEHEKNIKELTDRLKCEHRGEIDSIRARFKLMARTPSENSLEKIGEYSSITNTETLILQMSENFECEKEVAVNDAVCKENDRWSKILDEKVAELTKNFEEEKGNLSEELMKKIGEEKDKQIDVLREQMRNLSLDCIKYKHTILQLTEYSEDSDTGDLTRRIENLEGEKRELEGRIRSLQAGKPEDMAASVAVCEGKFVC